MKGLHLALVFLLISLLNFAAVAGPTKEAPRKSALQNELFSKEKAVWDAYKKKDAKALGQLLADDYYAVEDADGEIMTKSDALQSVGDLNLKTVEMKDWALVEINRRATDKCVLAFDA